MVLRLKPFSGQWKNDRATRNGAVASPAFSTYDSALYLGEPGSNDWHVEFDSDATHWVDVHVF